MSCHGGAETSLKTTLLACIALHYGDGVMLPVRRLALWSVLMMKNDILIKEDGSLHFAFVPNLAASVLVMLMTRTSTHTDDRFEEVCIRFFTLIQISG